MEVAASPTPIVSVRILLMVVAGLKHVYRHIPINSQYCWTGKLQGAIALRHLFPYLHTSLHPSLPPSTFIL